MLFLTMLIPASLGVLVGSINGVFTGSTMGSLGSSFISGNCVTLGLVSSVGDCCFLIFFSSLPILFSYEEGNTSLSIIFFCGFDLDSFSIGLISVMGSIIGPSSKP